MSRQDEQMRQHTCCGRNRTTEKLAEWIGKSRQDDTHPGGGTAPQEGQQVGFSGADRMTYILMVEQCHRRVSRVDLQEQMR